MSGWQPIETAPRSDGTLAWLSDGRWMAVAAWDADNDVWVDRLGYEFENPTLWAEWLAGRPGPIPKDTPTP